MTEPVKKAEVPLEADPVWDLVDKAPTQPASSHFASATVRMVREQQERKSAWWKQLFAPMPLAGLAAAAAAVALVVNVSMNTPDAGNFVDNSNFDSVEAVAIQEVVEVEMLMVAADNPSEFTDQELVTLLGF